MNRDIISLAPGRTCLFGDHQDYIGLPIIACAINKYIKIVAKENNKDFFYIKKPDINEERVIDIYEEVVEVKKGDNLLSAIKVLKRYDCIPDRGFDILISGNLPINSGVSSSSAVVVAWVKFLLEAFGSSMLITPELVSQIAFEAEVMEHGFPGGKMDQYSIGLGNVLYLETGEDLMYNVLHKPIEGLIIAESGIPKETIGVLQELKEKVWSAINKVKETYKNFDIRNAKKQDLEKYLNCLPDNLEPYLYAAITNHDITQRAFLELKKEKLDYPIIGGLINEHHQILRDVLKITVPRIDAMINAAKNAGAYGAKIVGSGRGGSIMVLAPNTEKDKIIDAIKLAGARDAYSVMVDTGARIINSTKNNTKKTF